MGIGGGIVADSKEESEYEECLLKAHFLTKVDAPFELIETLRYEKEEGFHLLERHLARLHASAHHFGYPFSREAVLAALNAEAARITAPVAMVRCLLAEDGTITVTSTEITLPTKDTVWRFVISDQRIDEKDPLFYHKTTRRQFYDREMERQKALTGCDEVVFLNHPRRADGGNAHHAVPRAGRSAVHAGTILRASARYVAGGTARSAARRGERGGADAGRPRARRPHLSRQLGPRA